MSMIFRGNEMEILAVFIMLLFNWFSLYLIAKDLDEIENELKKRK